MRMKLYTAPTRDEAMAIVLKEMGDDVVILSERESEYGYELRAAVERATSVVAPQFALGSTPPRPELQMNRFRERLKDVLVWHGAPEGFADIVASSGSKLVGSSEDATAGFAAALEGLIGFAPIEPGIKKPIMLVGPPGGGKTATAAKLVRRANAAGAIARPFMADFDATHATAQLAAYLRVDEHSIQTFHTPDDMFMAYRKACDIRGGQGVVIDTPPINPSDEEDLERLSDLINLLKIEPVLVVSGEGHPLDLEESIRAFGKLGVKRCIVTKLDVVRRRGGILHAIASGRMNLSHLALTPFIGGGLIPATPIRLARILMEDAPETEALKGAA